MLIFEFLERWVRYNETIFGSVGKEFKPCFAQKAPKSLKSDLYALKVLFALELLRLFSVAHEAILGLLSVHSYNYY